jgi:hypothetical protein
MGVGGQRYAPAAFTPGEDPVPIVQEAGWAPGPVWTGAKYLAPSGIRSPDRPTLSESLYRLSYPGPLCYVSIRVYTVKVLVMYLTSKCVTNSRGLKFVVVLM